MEEGLFSCPCCGDKTLTEERAWEVCSVCKWEDDPLQFEKPEYEGGANKESLNQARANWQSRSA